MNKKSILAALVLITVGMIIGVLLVSNISGGVEPGLAGTSGDVKLGAAPPAIPQNQTLTGFQETFVAVLSSTRVIPRR